MIFLARDFNQSIKGEQMAMFARENRLLEVHSQIINSDYKEKTIITQRELSR